MKERMHICFALILLLASMAVGANSARDSDSSGSAASFLPFSVPESRNPSREELANYRADLVKKQEKSVPVDKDVPSPDGRYAVHLGIRAASDDWLGYYYDIWNRSNGQHEGALDAESFPYGLKWVGNEQFVTVEHASQGGLVSMIHRDEGGSWTKTLVVCPEMEHQRWGRLISASMRGNSPRFVFAVQMFWSEAGTGSFRITL